MRRTHANRISLAVLIRYGGHLIWLLGDLLRGRPTDSLIGRQCRSTPPQAQWNAKASVLKVPHHGARDACFDRISAVFTRCDPNDVVVFSASGGIHPDPGVWKYWHDTGKRLCSTWVAVPVVRETPLDGWAWDELEEIAPRPAERVPRDVVVCIPKDGAVSISYPSPDGP